MSRIEIEKEYAIRRGVDQLFKRASEWHSFETLRTLPDPDDGGIEGNALRQNFLVSYAQKHRGMPGIDDVQCVVMKVRADLYHDIAHAIGDQVKTLNHLLQPQSDEPDAPSIRHYSASKRKHYGDRDIDNGNLVSFSIESAPVEGDAGHLYMGVFMHPELRALTAAHLLQREKRALS